MIRDLEINWSNLINFTTKILNSEISEIEREREDIYLNRETNYFFNQGFFFSMNFIVIFYSKFYDLEIKFSSRYLTRG